jgi:hypothetical protein
MKKLIVDISDEGSPIRMRVLAQQPLHLADGTLVGMGIGMILETQTTTFRFGLSHAEVDRLVSALMGWGLA